MKTLNIANVISKLNKLVAGRFGVGIQYIPLSDRSEEVAVSLETVRRNSGSPMIIAQDQLLIPMRVEGFLVGATRVSKINLLNPTEITQIKETIDLVLGEAFNAQAKIDLADLRIEYLVGSENDSNVFFINRKETEAIKGSRTRAFAMDSEP